MSGAGRLSVAMDMDKNAFAELMRHRQGRHRNKNSVQNKSRVKDGRENYGSWSVRCPICLRMFPSVSLLEPHAEFCGQIMSQEEDMPKRREEDVKDKIIAEQEERLKTKRKASSLPSRTKEDAKNGLEYMRQRRTNTDTEASNIADPTNDKDGKSNAFERLMCSQKSLHIVPQRFNMIRDLVTVPSNKDDSNGNNNLKASVHITRFTWDFFPSKSQDMKLIPACQWSDKVNLKISRTAYTDDVKRLNPTYAVQLPLTLSFSKIQGKDNLSAVTSFKDYLVNNNISSQNRNYVSNSYNNNPGFSISVLKSAIQKNVRLNRPHAAIRCAIQLILVNDNINNSIAELLRRISIICLEDAFLHPKFPFLIFLMVTVQKQGFDIDVFQVDAVLRILFDLARVKYKDDFSSHETDTDGHNSSDGLTRRVNEHHSGQFDLDTVKDHLLKAERKDNEGDNHIKSDEAVLICSLLLRASYGGMAGDVSLMNDAAQAWFKRLIISGNNEKVNNRTRWMDFIQKLYTIDGFTAAGSTCNTSLSNFAAHENSNSNNKFDTSTEFLDNTSRVLHFNDIPLSAIDFHCSNVLEEVLNDQGVYVKIRDCVHNSNSNNDNNRSNYTVLQYAERAMWRFSSSITHKKVIDAKSFKFAGNCNEDSDHTYDSPASTDVSEEDVLTGVWNIIKESCLEFQKNYISLRMNRAAKQR